jgi:molybdopterin molybdotransferase
MEYIPFQDAFSLIMEQAGASATVPKNLSLLEARGKILAGDIVSPLDMPPFDKSAMDGFAIKVSDTCKVPIDLKIIGTLRAGQPGVLRIQAGECVRIMTGSPIPQGSDAVVPVEEVAESGSWITLKKTFSPGEHICVQGEDIKNGQVVAERGTRLLTSLIPLLATVGRTTASVYGPPQVALINTGDEIVEPGVQRPPSSIYNANGPNLHSLLMADEVPVKYMGIVPDEDSILKAAISEALKADIILITGGVSAGQYDRVPFLLNELGVQPVFHKVRIKPGKPLFFGVYGKKLVFGIPGNPVSNFLVYHLFIRPAILKMMGHGGPLIDWKKGAIEAGGIKRSERLHFIPVKALFDPGRAGYLLEPVENHGSADVFGLSKANGFAMIEPEASPDEMMAGFPFFMWNL